MCYEITFSKLQPHLPGANVYIGYYYTLPAVPKRPLNLITHSLSPRGQWFNVSNTVSLIRRLYLTCLVPVLQYMLDPNVAITVSADVVGHQQARAEWRARYVFSKVFLVINDFASSLWMGWWTAGPFPWWRHQMETFSALLAICVGNSPVTGGISTRRPVTVSFDIFIDLRLFKRLNKQSWGWWYETPSHSLWRHRNVISCTLKQVLNGRCLSKTSLIINTFVDTFCEHSIIWCK